MPKSSVRLLQGPAQHQSHPFTLCICYSLSYHVCASFLLAQVPPCIFPSDKRERLIPLISKNPTDALQPTTANRTTEKNVYQACTHTVSANCCAGSHAAGCQHRPQQHRRHRGLAPTGKPPRPSPSPGGTKPSPRLQEAPWVPHGGIYSPRTRPCWRRPSARGARRPPQAGRALPAAGPALRASPPPLPHGAARGEPTPARPRGTARAPGPAGPVPPGAGPEARGAAGGAGPRGHHGNFQNVPPGPAATASRGQWAPSAWLTLLR